MASVWVSPEQSSIVVAPGNVVPNRGQLLHDRDPKFGWYFPLGHSSHCSPSTLSLYWPGLHGTTTSRDRDQHLHADCVHDGSFVRSLLRAGVQSSLLWTPALRPFYQPSYLPGIISLFIMCIGIIRNNSLVDVHDGTGWRKKLLHWPALVKTCQIIHKVV